MEEKNTNMELWKKYATPPAEAKKPFKKVGFSGTDISPMWRIRCLTEEFGPCGFGWYTEIVDRWTETVNGMPMAFVTIKLYVRRDEWSKPITATGGNSFCRKVGGDPSDEVYKMAYTDALGGACKMLGIGGAVYWERGYSKYEADYVQPEPATAQRAYPYAQPELTTAKNIYPTELYGVTIIDPPAEPPKPAYDLMQEPVEGTEYRILALTAYSEKTLDASCMRKFGTDFSHTPWNKIREMLPDDKLKSTIEKKQNQSQREESK